PDSVTATLSTVAAVGSSSAVRGVCCSLNGHSFDGDGLGRPLGALDGPRRADLLEDVQPFGHVTEDAVAAGAVRRERDVGEDHEELASLRLRVVPLSGHGQRACWVDVVVGGVLDGAEAVARAP